MLKADPYALYSEKVPCGNSIVADLEEFSWNDREWMEARKAYADRRKPLSIYETRLTEWESGEELADFAAELGYTHVELHPVMEYLEDATDGYSTFALFCAHRAVWYTEGFPESHRCAAQKGVGVILDWCPAQFPRAEGGLERFDGTALYEVQDERMAVHPMWGTLLYNYDSPMVKDFLISNACFWSEIYPCRRSAHGRCGRHALSGLWKGTVSMPNIYGSNENLAAIEFLKHLNSIMKKRNPGVLLIAQEDGLWPQLTDSVENDHIGFDYKWSGGWTGDFLSYLGQNPALRKKQPRPADVVHALRVLRTLYPHAGKQRCRNPCGLYGQTSWNRGGEGRADTGGLCIYVPASGLQDDGAGQSVLQSIWRLHPGLEYAVYLLAGSL